MIRQGSIFLLSHDICLVCPCACAWAFVSCFSPKLVKVKIEGSIYLATEVTLFLLIAEGYIRIYESPYQLSVSMLRLLVHWSYVSCHGRTSRAGIYWCAS